MKYNPFTTWLFEASNDRAYLPDGYCAVTVELRAHWERNGYLYDQHVCHMLEAQFPGWDLSCLNEGVYEFKGTVAEAEEHMTALGLHKHKFVFGGQEQT